MATKEKLKILKNVSKRSLFKNKIPGGIFIQLKPEMLTKILTKKSVGGEMLKPVNKEKNPGLAKLPEKVRNKMGYAKKGKMAKAKKGMSVKGKMTKARTGKMIKANVGMAAKKVREKNMMKASMGASVRGFGAARTSGMGLQDEQLIPGKSLDYYKDLM